MNRVKDVLNLELKVFGLKAASGMLIQRMGGVTEKLDCFFDCRLVLQFESASVHLFCLIVIFPYHEMMT